VARLLHCTTCNNTVHEDDVERLDKWKMVSNGLQCPVCAGEETRKETNPKDRIGCMKAPTHYISSPVMFEMGLAMLEGAIKYGGHNFRVAGVRASIYFDAAKRHLDSYWEGEDIDPDSGLPHIIKAMACLHVLRDSQLMGNHTDDRPPRLPNGLDTKRLNAKAKEIIERHAHMTGVEDFTQQGLEDG